MKQNTKKRSLTPLRVILDHALHALEGRNFNLAEAWIEEYVKTIPQDIVDQPNTRAFFHAIQRRDDDLLSAAVQAEQERLFSMRVGELRKKILQKSKK